MSWLNEVTAARKSGCFTDAMAILERELHLRPEDPAVHYQIACTHDALGKERDAVPAYEKAIALGLAGEELPGAYLGLGSTYRTLGQYEKSREVLETGILLFPEYRPLQVFLALTLFNLGQHERAFEIVVSHLAQTTGDPTIKQYEKALVFYSDKMNQVFE